MHTPFLQVFFPLLNIRNWNLGLKYLNLSGNKRLEIKPSHPESHNPKERNLSDFSALSRLRTLGLMDVTILGVTTPEEYHDRRVRTSPSEVNGMGYGVADWLGPSDHLSTWDLVMPKFRNENDQCLLGLFDGRKYSKTGCRLTYFLNDNINQFFTNELQKTKQGDTIVSALRRTFLALEKEFGSMDTEDKEMGASGLICYIAGTKLYVANVGDTLAILSRNNGQAHEITQKHIPLHPSEISRIRAAGGFVSNLGLLNDEINVSRSFGYYHLIPVVNANPFISTIELEENDEFVIMASRGLWDRMSYQTAVDIARTEKDDLMIAAQKLRDFALTYGADSNIMVMIIGVGDLFNKQNKRKNFRGTNRSTTNEGGLLMEESIGTPGVMTKTKRRLKDEFPSDSVILTAFMSKYKSLTFFFLRLWHGLIKKYLHRRIR
jgi:adenylate cyclase